MAAEAKKGAKKKLEMARSERIKGQSVNCVQGFNEPPIISCSTTNPSAETVKGNRVSYRIGYTVKKAFEPFKDEAKQAAYRVAGRTIQAVDQAWAEMGIGLRKKRKKDGQQK